MTLRDFDTELRSDDAGIQTAIDGFGTIEVGIDDGVFLTQLAQIIKGADGADGAPGPPGGAIFSHTQAVPATVWNIRHDLGRYPPVTVIDSAGSEIEGEVKYLDLNNVRLSFTFAFAGTASLG